MRFKRYHSYILDGLSGAVLVSVVLWGITILLLLDGQPVGWTEKDYILTLLLFALSPLYIWWMMFSYVRYMARIDGGHFKDEIEMNSDGIRLHSRKTGDVFMTWENVVEILDVNHGRSPFEIVVRGTNAEINFFGNLKARRYLKRRTGLKIKKAPSDWRERTDWRKKYDADKM